MRFLNALLFAVTVSLTFSGCEILDAMKAPEFDSVKTDLDEAQYVFSIHKIVKYPMAKQLEREVPTTGGRAVWINMNPFLHSRDVQEIELIPSKKHKGFYDLRLKLNRAGKIKWIYLYQDSKLKDFGLLIDGVYYRKFQPEELDYEQEEWVVLKGPYDKITAEGLKKNAPKNYGKFSDD